MAKICKTCKVSKEVSEFPKNSRGKYGVGHVCKPCSAKYAREYRKINSVKLLTKKFNFEAPKYVEEFIQKDECEICHRKSPEVKLVTDHCHEVNVVRGKLCDRCNVGLGNFSDSEDRLLEAVLYLRKFKRGR